MYKNKVIICGVDTSRLPVMKEVRKGGSAEKERGGRQICPRGADKREFEAGFKRHTALCRTRGKSRRSVSGRLHRAYKIDR